MEQINHKSYPGTPFSIDHSVVDNGPNKWKSTHIIIYNQGKEIGQYIRNYNSVSLDTFAPFLCNDQWYALYSPHYTATRVLKLNDTGIEDWCGEEQSSNGFCPVEYYIPKYNTFLSDDVLWVMVDSEYDTYEEFIHDAGSENTLVHTSFCNFAFMSGCVWGDDGTWKLRYIDLSNIESKEIVFMEKFGYCMLPKNLKLKQCIDMSSWEPECQTIGIHELKYVNLSK